MPKENGHLCTAEGLCALVCFPLARFLAESEPRSMSRRCKRNRRGSSRRPSRQREPFIGI